MNWRLADSGEKAEGSGFGGFQVGESSFTTSQAGYCNLPNIDSALDGYVFGRRRSLRHAESARRKRLSAESVPVYSFERVRGILREPGHFFRKFDSTWGGRPRPRRSPPRSRMPTSGSPEDKETPVKFSSAGVSGARSSGLRFAKSSGPSTAPRKLASIFQIGQGDVKARAELAGGEFFRISPWRRL